MSQEIDENKLGDEVIKTDDLSNDVESIKLSSGVEFTQEELEGMDPQILEKLLKVKAGDENFSRGINQKTLKIKELEAQLAAGKQVETPQPEVEKPATPAPAGESDITKLYVMKQMAKENFAEAKSKAAVQYGDEVVNLIGAKYSTLFKDLVEKGQHDANFDGLYSQAFINMLSDDADKSVFEAYTRFKQGINEEQIKVEAEAKAKVEILKAKESTTTGLPAGGAQVVTPPVVNAKPKTLAEAKKLWKEKVKEMKEKEK